MADSSDVATDPYIPLSERVEKLRKNIAYNHNKLLELLDNPRVAEHEHASELHDTLADLNRICEKLERFVRKEIGEAYARTPTKIS